MTETESISTRSRFPPFQLPFVIHVEDSQSHVNQHYYGGEI